MKYDQSVWVSTGKLRPISHPLQEPIETDVAIIGAGFTGLATAYYLQKYGIKTITLEANSVGWGASGRNAGMILPGFKKSYQSLTKKWGMEDARSMLNFSIKSIDTVENIVKENEIDCSFTRNGSIRAAFKPAHMDALKKEQEFLANHFDYPLDILDKEEMQNEVNSELYWGGLVDPNGASFQPFNYTLGLADCVETLGGKIFEQSKVISIERSKDSVTLKTESGKVKAKRLVVATNGYTTPVSKRLAKSVIPIGSYIIATEPLHEDLVRQLIPSLRPVSDTKKFLYYFRITPDKRMLFGGRVSFNGVETPELFKELREQMLSVFPQLKEARIDYRWGGMTGFTFDQFPHVGQTKEGDYYSLGYCGHGASKASLMGKVIAERIAGVKREEEKIESLPLRRIPMHSQRTLALHTVGIYYSIYDRLY